MPVTKGTKYLRYSEPELQRGETSGVGYKIRGSWDNFLFI